MTTPAISGWTTADYALFVSLASAAISLLSLSWNVWSKFIYPKPRLRVHCGMMTTITPGKTGTEDDVISVSIVNHGPAEVTVSMVLVDAWSKWRRKHRHGLLNPLHDYPLVRRRVVGPFGGGLPKKLAVGEQFALYFIPDHEGIADPTSKAIGVSDVFGRIHWAPKKAFRELQKNARERVRVAGKITTPLQ